MRSCKPSLSLLLLLRFTLIHRFALPVIKLKKENAKLNSEVENYRLHKKANDVLVKNHKELTQKVDILIKSSAKKPQKVKKENRELFTPTRLNLKATTTTPKKT